MHIILCASHSPTIAPNNGCLTPAHLAWKQLAPSWGSCPSTNSSSSPSICHGPVGVQQHPYPGMEIMYGHNSQMLYQWSVSITGAYPATNTWTASAMLFCMENEDNNSVNLAPTPLFISTYCKRIYPPKDYKYVHSIQGQEVLHLLLPKYEIQYTYHRVGRL